MNVTLDIDPQAVLHQLRKLENEPSAPPESRKTAAEWHRAISATVAFLADRSHPVAFIGSVGVGKSSLMTVLSKLLVGPALSDRASLKESSVLPIGSGRTTVCEVQIRAARPGDGGCLGLQIEPYSAEDMAREIEIYAEDEWTRQSPESQSSSEDRSDPSQEVHRAIRGLTGYAEHHETVPEGGVRRRRLVRPLHEVVPRFDSPHALAKHLLERAALPARARTEWWWPDATPENLRALKALLEAVNQGAEPAATLPQKMVVVVPEPLPGSTCALDLTLIDTRGLDGKVESRRDLQDLLRNPRTLVILCTPFKDAPGDSVRAVLRFLAGDAELRQAISRTLMVLLDQGDAEQVNGAGGDRDLGQELKIDECHVALEGAGLPRMLERGQIVAFDVLKDNRLDRISAIDDRLHEIREPREHHLEQQVKDAQSFLESVDNELRELVDREIRDTLARHPLKDIPLHDPLTGLYEAVHDCRDAAVVYATCRRNGMYSRLDLYAAVRALAWTAASVWQERQWLAVLTKLAELEQDPKFALVLDHIHLRKAQFNTAQYQVARDYSERIGEQVESLLRADPVWQACRSEWGRGAGFKSRVVRHLKEWCERQRGLTAHERTTATTEIPLLKEVAPPVETLPLRIQVESLGPIRRADVTFADLTVLVGPQATGKSIFLQLLKLICDKTSIHRELRRFGLDWGADSRRFLDLYFGQGMARIWTDATGLNVDGQPMQLSDFALSASDSTEAADTRDRMFFIPAQRVMSLREGQTRPFTDYRAGDPYSLREFSEQVHSFVESELVSEGPLFPRTNRIEKVYQDAIARNVFGAFGVQTESNQAQRRIVLADKSGTSLPYLVWSAGQREFVPLLLGLYWLMPPLTSSHRKGTQWVVIEEPEMGLHPHAISVFLALVLDLLSRGYRVVLATHSPHVLDVVWGLQFLKAHGGEPKDLLEMLGLPAEIPVVRAAGMALEKSYRVYYFERGGEVRDISSLDPGAEDPSEAGWGGLSEFSGRVGNIVAKVARRFEAAEHE